MNTYNKKTENEQCNIPSVSNSLIRKIFEDKPAMCRLFNILVNCKLKSKNLDFELKPYENDYYILISLKRFGRNKVRSTVHIEIDELAQLQIRRLVNGTHYVNSINEDMTDFIFQKEWINMALRFERIKKLENEKREIETKLLGLYYFNYG